jgi:hypothetical protein
MCKDMSVIPVNRVVDTKIIIGKGGLSDPLCPPPMTCLGLAKTIDASRKDPVKNK